MIQRLVLILMVRVLSECLSDIDSDNLADSG